MQPPFINCFITDESKALCALMNTISQLHNDVDTNLPLQMRKWDTEKLSKLPKSSQLGKGEHSIETQKL